MRPPPDCPGAIWAIVVAGGGGSRFGSAKQYERLAGREVLDWSVTVAATAADGVVVVVPRADVDRAIPGAARVVAGGATRAASVRAGLAAVPAGAGIVVVHDAARPAASPALFARVTDAVRAGAVAVVPAVAVTDSLRTRDGVAVDRDTLVAVQTPQGFRADVLRRSHAGGGEASDDATLVERTGATIVIVDGETTNVKLTHRPDRILLEQALVARGGGNRGSVASAGTVSGERPR